MPNPLNNTVFCVLPGRSIAVLISRRSRRLVQGGMSQEQARWEAVASVERDIERVRQDWGVYRRCRDSRAAMIEEAA